MPSFSSIPSSGCRWRFLASLVFLLPSAIGLAEGDTGFAAKQAAVQKAFKEDVTPFVKEFCVRCHGSRPKAGLNLEVALRSPGSPAFSRKWLDCFANVNARDMPPDNADQPNDEERQRFLDALAQIKYLSDPDPGIFIIRRLSKVEYGNTLRDLLGVDPSIARELPDEVRGEGYLNSLSPMQSEQFLRIANEAIQQMPEEARTRLLGEKDSDPREVARRIAREAYRRPPTDAEIDVLARVYQLGRTERLGHTASLRLMLKAVLVSPQFLFITPSQPALAGQRIVPLDDHQIASRLSYFIWATMPDAELSRLADEGRLREPTVLQAQMRRLIASPLSRALFDGFGSQWLGLDSLATMAFDPGKFPQMTSDLRSAMYEEARLYFESILRGNRSLVTFVDGDYTYLNSSLASLYGLEKKVTGSALREVKLADANRGGILSMPGILAATSFSTRTSAVKRGVWVLEQVLGQRVPPAPPNVPALERLDQAITANLTLRQRTELHRTDAVCANCHKMLDPIGFGLENFDAIGRWREKDDTGGPIDAAGELPDGKRFSSPRELKALIAARSDDLARNLTERLLAYALSRPLDAYDHIVVDEMLGTIAADDYKMQTVIGEIVTSYPFLNRRVRD